jgi:hypothetical protein
MTFVDNYDIEACQCDVNVEVKAFNIDVYFDIEDFVEGNFSCNYMPLHEFSAAILCHVMSM